MYIELCFDYNYVYKIVSLYFTIIIYSEYLYLFTVLCPHYNNDNYYYLRLSVLSSHQYINCMLLISNFGNKDNIYYQDIFECIIF